VKSVLERNWTKPTLHSPVGEAFIRIRINPDGSLTPLGISRSSGNAILDESALAAVRAARTVGKPLPEGLGSPNYEVVVNFKLD
jgi:protein TonB